MGLLNWFTCSVLGAPSCCPHCFRCYRHPSMHQELGTDWNWDGESITKWMGFSFSYSFQDPSLHNVRPQRAYSKASDAGNRCRLCVPVVSCIHLEENPGRIHPANPCIIHRDNPITCRSTTSWRSIWAVYFKDCGTTSTLKQSWNIQSRGLLSNHSLSWISFSCHFSAWG